jgi:hypothetical protein
LARFSIYLASPAILTVTALTHPALTSLLIATIIGIPYPMAWPALVGIGRPHPMAWPALVVVGRPGTLQGPASSQDITHQAQQMYFSSFLCQAVLLLTKTITRSSPGYSVFFIERSF